MSADDAASRRSKTALVLAGGGVTGAVYEIGALRALDDLLLNFGVRDFDIFVGTSAGSLVAACLANGLTPREMMRALERQIDGVAPLSFGDLFTLDSSSLLRRSTSLPRALFASLRTFLLARGRVSLLDVIETLALALPDGLYDVSALERYLVGVLARPGLTNDFTKLKPELAIIATELDTGARVVFGSPPFDHVPIARAVAASSAMPLVYRPVRIDGRDYIDGGVRGNASVDLAIERGARLIICVNPLVPYHRVNSDDAFHIGDLGAPGVVSQTFRTLAYAGLHYHLKQIQRQRPDVDLILIEPAHNDVRMFSEMPMRYASRLEVARHGFETVAAQLSHRYEEYSALLARHDIRIKRHHAVDRLATVSHNLASPPDTRDLREALVNLDRLLSEIHPVEHQTQTREEGHG